MFTRIVNIAFLATLGLYFLNFRFEYQTGIIGVTALVLALIAIIGPGVNRPAWF